MKITARIQIENAIHTIEYDEPDSCPLCHRAIKPEQLYFASFSDRNQHPHLAGLYLCKNCYQVFLAMFDERGNFDVKGVRQYWTRYIGPKKYKPSDFDSQLKALSPNFVKIYNQAKEAESSELNEIAGIGYRKALEFLIKDYLIYLQPDEVETIKGMTLGNCIANKVTNEKIKTVASRSAWLGNDMAHYVQRFADKDIDDMKKFIDATMYWISMELTTDEALSISSAR